MSQLLEHIPLLHRLTDALALLDMLTSFAEAAAASEDSYCAPDLHEAGPLAIVQVRSSSQTE